MGNTQRTVERETGRWDGVHCTLALERPARGVAVLRIAGRDVGEFGDAPMRALEEHLSTDGSIELFLDARDSDGATIDVSSEWAQWLGAHRSRCDRICMLAGSRFIEITAKFVRRFADLGEIMRIYTDAAAFDQDLALAIARARQTAH